MLQMEIKALMKNVDLLVSILSCSRVEGMITRVVDGVFYLEHAFELSLSEESSLSIVSNS